MAVFACTSCGWVRRSQASVAEARCPICGSPARSLTPHGRLPDGRARAAAAGVRALGDRELAPTPPRAA